MKINIKTKLKESGEALLKSIHEKNDHQGELVIKDTSLVKMTKEECIVLCKKIGLEFRDGFEKRVIQFRFTDATADRHNEVVLPEGMDLKSFKKDPIILLQHNSFKFPIGKSLHTEFDKDNNDIVGKILFFDDETDRTGVSEDTFRMVLSGAMKNGSIGFRAKREHVRLATPDELKKFGLDEFGIMFVKSELREFSIVTIGANPNSGKIPARKDAFREDTLEHLKKEGLDEEALTFLKGLDPKKNDDPPETKTQKTPMEVIVNIGKNDNSEVIDKKLKLAEDQQAKGNDVTINFGEKNDFDPDEIIKAGAVLSKKNKSIINNVLSNLTTLSDNLNALLKSTKPSDGNPDKNDPDDSSQKNSEDGDSSLSDLIEAMNEKVKPKD